jgi:hypothetical protein
MPIFIPVNLGHMLAQHEGHQMEMEHSQEMHRGMHSGELGNYPMSQEGSGTAWLPQSSPHHAYMLPVSGPWAQHLMGTFFAGYVDAGGKRGGQQAYSSSMAMYMAKREMGNDTLGFHAMISLDPIFNGERGVPNLFQTGETAHGQPLVDRQHPHDLVAELAFIYSHPFGANARGFLYAAPIGEPALGNTMFLHRPSGYENPEAPITHHWFDSTHISFGVVTAGVTVGDKWKLDASAFNGHEPDENRYVPDPLSLNSASGRVTFNPNKDLSFSASYGFLDSPEALEPGVDVHRFTASAMVNRPMGDDNLALAFMFGRNSKNGEHQDAWNLEAGYSTPAWSLYGRWENVDKDELVGVPAGTYRINKVVFGGTRNLMVRDGFEYGLGGYVGLYAFPSSLEPFYGRNPVSFGIYLRLRPAKM